MSYRDHATRATELLDDVHRRVADPHAIAAAQVHATLAVAAAVDGVTDLLDDIALAPNRRSR
ncbi:MAG: hypothetical protein GEV07_30515 [Streptosporangiales bacterium]|nr:hypothetical protein [Streptosporangiales bacterium]